MKTKRGISLFLILVMSIQIIPMQQIAAWLSSGQVTEEIAHCINPVKGKSGSCEKDPIVMHAYGSVIHSLLATSLVKHNIDEAIYLRYADDILTPPPNC
jgi:hypothetical protein